MSDSEQDEIVVKQAIGERLKSARETQKMSQSQVAEKLHLTTSIITALENQQWDKLNGRTYCRGYFLNYVKLLDLPYDEMLAAFNDAYDADDDTYSPQHLSLSKKRPISIAVWLIILLVCGAVIAAVMWVDWNKLGFDLERVSTTDMIQEDDAQEPDLNLIAESESSIEDNVEQQSMLASAVTDFEDGVPQPEIENVELVNSDVAMTLLEPMQESVDDQQFETMADMEPELPHINHISLSFNDDCWVEIKQGNTKVLVSEVKTANDKLEFESSEPFDLLIGRAKAVTIEFNGLPVDLTQFSQGEVARLTLGEAS